MFVYISPQVALASNFISCCPSGNADVCILTLWRPVVPLGYSYEASYARPG